MYYSFVKGLFVLSLGALVHMPASALLGGGSSVVFCTNCATDVNLTAQAVRLANAIQGNATSVSKAVSENARLVSEANALTEARMERARIVSRYDLTDPCVVTAPGRGDVYAPERERGHASGRGAGGGGGSGRPTSVGGGAGATPMAGASTNMQKALAISMGNEPAPNPEATAAIAASGACATYAFGGDRDRNCQGAKFMTGVSSGFPNADVRAETLFDGPQNQAAMSKGVVRRLTVPANDSPERTAIAAYIRNLETPIDLRALRPKELDTVAGRNYIATRDSYEAVMSLATKPLRDQELSMLANKETLSAINQMLAGADSGFVRNWLTKAYPNWQAQGVSFLELMNLEAVRRYKNETWYVRMAQQDERNLVLEQVNMQALQIWQNNLMLERQQQQNILLGAIAGVLLRGEKLPALIAQHKAAQTP